MASSFVNFREEKVGFWIKDSVFQVACNFLLSTIGKFRTKEKWLQEFEDLLRLNTEGIFTGWMHLDLDEYLIDDNRIGVFLEIINLTKKEVQAEGETVNLDRLNSHVVNPRLQSKWQQPVESRIFLRVFDYLELLVKGKLTFRSDGPIDYWNYR